MAPPAVLRYHLLVPFLPLAFASAALLATLFGGLLALRFRDHLHLVLGFSAGAVIGVAFFDLLPEAIELGEPLGVGNVTALAALGFVGYLLFDRLTEFRANCGDLSHGHHAHGPHARGDLGAASLALHSLLDGVAVGLAFQASAAVGAVVAVAVLVHDFSDGVNTVGLVLKTERVGGPARDRAFRWLVVDAAAPVVGAASTMLFSLPEGALAVVLALFSGFFVYIGASELVPESHHAHPKLLTTAMTALGVAVMFAAVRLAGF